MHQAKSSTTLSFFVAPHRLKSFVTQGPENAALQAWPVFSQCCTAQLVAKETTSARNFRKPHKIKGFGADTGFLANLLRRGGVDKRRAVA
jgi:hypothetical protein